MPIYTNNVTTCMDETKQTAIPSQRVDRKSIAMPRDVCGPLCKAFGLEGYRVRRLVVTCEVNSIPTLLVERFLTREEAAALDGIEMELKQ